MPPNVRSATRARGAGAARVLAALRSPRAAPAPPFPLAAVVRVFEAADAAVPRWASVSAASADLTTDWRSPSALSPRLVPDLDHLRHMAARRPARVIPRLTAFARQPGAGSGHARGDDRGPGLPDGRTATTR